MVASQATVQDFKMPTDLLRQLDNWERLKIEPQDMKIAEELPYGIIGKMTGWVYLRPTEDLGLVEGVSSSQGKGIFKRTVYLSGNTLDESKGGKPGFGTHEDAAIEAAKQKEGDAKVMVNKVLRIAI